MTDLEQLSRDAAKVLTQKFEFKALEFNASIGCVWSRYDEPGIPLHESTEACAEIYIRELMPLGVYLIQSSGTIVAWNSEGTIELAMVALLPDEMQAFRTAVLRALIEVKK